MGRSEGVEFFQHVATWLALVEGRKHWMLANPHAEKPEENPTCSMDTDGDARSKEVLHCIQEPGDIIYFPDNWWHSTCNLAETTIGIGGQRYIPGWPSPAPEVIQAVFRQDINRLIAAVSFCSFLPSPVGLCWCRAQADSIPTLSTKRSPYCNTFGSNDCTRTATGKKWSVCDAEQL